MISVILVNWNNWADTIACIQSLLRAESAEFRIIVVDNASPNSSFDIFRKWTDRDLCIIEDELTTPINSIGEIFDEYNSFFVEFNNITQHFVFEDNALSIVGVGLTSVYFVKGWKNGGFGYGCNVGMRLADQMGTDSIWLLNNDCIVSRDSIMVLKEYVSKNRNELVGVHLKYYYEPNQFQAVGGGMLNRLTGKFHLHTTPADHLKLNYIHGASLAFSADCLDRVGFFDEKIFMYCEEVDYCLRASSLGYKFKVLPIEIFHKEGASQNGSSSVNAWTQVLINKHYVLKKNIGWGCWVFFFFAMLVIRSLMPFGSLNARIGARRALAHFLQIEKI
jgi:GT2 family glycosyltransferase